MSFENPTLGRLCVGVDVAEVTIRLGTPRLLKSRWFSAWC